MKGEWKPALFKVHIKDQDAALSCRFTAAHLPVEAPTRASSDASDGSDKENQEQEFKRIAQVSLMMVSGAQHTLPLANHPALMPRDPFPKIRFNKTAFLQSVQTFCDFVQVPRHGRNNSLLTIPQRFNLYESQLALRHFSLTPFECVNHVLMAKRARLSMVRIMKFWDDHMNESYEEMRRNPKMLKSPLTKAVDDLFIELQSRDDYEPGRFSRKLAAVRSAL